MKLEDVFGIGKKTASKLRNSNIWSPYDLILTFPKSYENYNITNFYNAKHLDIITVIGKITKIESFQKRINIIKLVLEVDQVLTNIIIFNQPFLLNSLKVNDFILVKGKYNVYKNEIAASQISKNIEKSAITGLYNILDVTNHTMAVAIKHLLDKKEVAIYETLPKDVLRKYQLLPRDKAIYQIHFPKDEHELDNSLKRFKYEEAIHIQLNLQKEKLTIPKRNKIEYNLEIVKNFISSLPYELTDDQKKATNDIFRDFKGELRSKRLIQGDVGSGKTIVAVIAALGMISAKKQVVLMVPTEILAHQQYENIKKLLPEYNVELLTSKIKDKNQIKEDVKNGHIDFLIGTHAVASEDLIFNDLGLVIIDEQHKFGVELRESLLSKSESADLIYLTATPIPRTLGIAIFGDLETSIIKSRPNFQKPIITKYYTDDKIEECYKEIDNAIKNEEHVFIVVPAISSTLKDYSINSVKDELIGRYQDKLFILHGEIKSNERSDIIDAFSQEKGAVLLATSMVEVGIDLKSATMMVVLGAENFGLSQLHQLRGRVGRGDKQGYFYAISQNEDVERLTLLETTNDGFRLSEIDLQLRGPGEFLGLKQSGIFDSKFIDFNQDYQILVDAKQFATDLLNNPFKLKDPDYYYLNKIVNHN